MKRAELLEIRRGWVAGYLEKSGKMATKERIATITGLSAYQVARYLRRLRKARHVVTHRAGRVTYWGWVGGIGK